MSKRESIEPEKMYLKSMDVAEEKRSELKRCLGQAFPEIFAEGSVNFEQLKRLLGDWVDPTKERFGLNWPGKSECMKVIQQPSAATLKPIRKDSVDFDETENVFIEGDNLEVLKLLQKSYFGKIKTIYIDPPYNTGNEFIYPDNYSETLETYLAYTGQTDSEGRRFSANTDTAGRYHSRWLNMMYPRLYLAKNLLRDDGVIFVSIDDHEAHNLRSLMNEVFGEENYYATIAWQRRDTPANDAKALSVTHEYLIVFQKSDEFTRQLLPRSEEQLENYKNPDNDPRGPWIRTSLIRKEVRADRIFPIRNPKGEAKTPPPGTSWRLPPETFASLEKDNCIWWGQDSDGELPFRKRFLSEVQSGVVPVTWWDYKFAGSNRNSKIEIRSIFDQDVPFDTPKPSSLIQQVLRVSSDSDGIVLDFFAGSGTTAHAVMELNKEDGGNRRFILVQLPEPTGRSDYATIADIAKERIRRVARKISDAKKGRLDLNQSSSQDLGFKAFKLDRSNFSIWDGNANEFEPDGQQLEMHVDHLSPVSSAEDTLYELLLKSGFSLTTKVKIIEMAGKQVFSVQDGALLVCLEKDITPELIDALSEANPLQVVCLDEGFKGNDQLKANAVQTFRARAQAEESEIVFRTV